MFKTFFSKIVSFIKKFSAFDWIVIIVIVASGIFTLWNFAKKTYWITIEIKLTSPSRWTNDEKPSSPYWLADKIKLGDAEYSFSGQKIAEVTDIRSWGDEKKDVWITLKILAEHNNRQKKMTFDYQPVEVGKPFQVTLGRNGVEGFITYVEGTADTRVHRKRIVQMRVVQFTTIFPETLGVNPWIAEAIQQGDKMLNTQNHVVAEILSVDVKPAEKIAIGADGNSYLRQDPIKKDIFLTVKIETVVQGNAEYFLDDKVVKVDSFLPLFLPHVDITPVVTKIIE